MNLSRRTLNPRGLIVLSLGRLRADSRKRKRDQGGRNAYPAMRETLCMCRYLLINESSQRRRSRATAMVPHMIHARIDDNICIVNGDRYFLCLVLAPAVQTLRASLRCFLMARSHPRMAVVPLPRIPGSNGDISTVTRSNSVQIHRT